MKAMSIEELYSLRTRRKKGSNGNMAAKLLREFTESGYEVCQLEPSDVGCSEFTKSKVNYLCRIFNKQAIALKLDKIVFAETHGDRLYLVRIDV